MSKYPSLSALIVAAGKGVRAGDDLPKQYKKIGQKTVLAHAVDALLEHVPANQLQVVIGKGHHQLYDEAVGDRGLLPPVLGGVTRRDSVLAGLKALKSELVLIHDAARPFLPAEVVDRLVTALRDRPGAIPILPVADTLAVNEDGSLLGPTVDRSKLARVQTPQAFHLTAIVDAHAAWPTDREATDDAQVAREAGLTVALVAGDPSLDKLTFPADFEAAERRWTNGMSTRTGMGFDVHAFAEGDAVWIGGVSIPHGKRLAGHSDADVALHALTDALLGTISEGDIGDHFPPSDPQWKGAASHIFLEYAAKLIRDRGGIIDHCDLTIICEAPKIGPHRAAIRSRIASLLDVNVERVSVKATTTEQLGFTGRREGIAAQAIASVRMRD